ncbi:MAG TPA: MBOAT family protein [Steroidobacteraceae bacterium]|nr:MBOAT family protein [Steroidobacteraceae bacterium]
MLFNSLVFLFAFLPVTYVVFWCLRTTLQRHVWLTITGYVFYGYWDPRFCLLMAFTTLVSYSAGRGFLSTQNPSYRKWLLVLPITVDLSVLGFFKYAGFFTRSLNDFADLLGWRTDLPVLDVILPIGISFYTFHTITYIVDAYRGHITPTRSFWEFGAYVSLFSQLVAGPIVRFRQIEKDLEHVGEAHRRQGLPVGLSFLAFGMFEKVIIADTLAYFVDPALDQYNSLSTVGAWLSMFGYTFQLYFDFAGYSAMAVGLGLMFGLRIPQNFNSPYRAENPSDFWRRWHISLSTVMRDYLYIPLGGNRGPTWMMYRNLMITMLIGGLWHGANWTFVIWGAYHGMLLLGYHYASSHGLSMPRPAAQLVTFILVVIGWVFFRSANLGMAEDLLHKMFVPQSGELPQEVVKFTSVAVLAAILARWAPNAFEYHRDFSPTATRMAAAAAVLGCSVALIAGSRASPFLYFQF